MLESGSAAEFPVSNHPHAVLTLAVTRLAVYRRRMSNDTRFFPPPRNRTSRLC